MTSALLALALVVLLAAGGLTGPRVLDRLPLADHPRAGITAWTSAVVVWTLGLLALGPLLAWSLSGPALPGAVGAACRRCLEAASPFGAADLPVSVPPAAALTASGLVVLGLVAALATTFLRSHRHVTAERAALNQTATLTTVAGTRVWLVPARAAIAYALPGRGTGIVVSEGTLASLGPAQLGAVLRHETAHVRGRHHALLALLRAVRTVFGAVPLVAAAPAAVAGYAEMAADDAARRAYGTRALAGALLALHGASDTTSTPGLALHAVGGEVSSRVRRLAGSSGGGSRLAVAMVGGYLLALTAAVLVVVGPTLAVVATGAC